ncbi:hypothetical protein DPMN_088685 [Dreissena polymorpha]|uniref:Uncharacterized protein n=1 Tax=Dreissena polymorpha TaxID=45954 RepID=A0A9D4KVC3_DREPO|nr:hypothetical protein DPMN_088685 [Dreissena polymorpha]
MSVLVVVAIFIEPYTPPITRLYWFGDHQPQSVKTNLFGKLWLNSQPKFKVLRITKTDRTSIADEIAFA